MNNLYTCSSCKMHFTISLDEAKNVTVLNADQEYSVMSMIHWNILEKNFFALVCCCLREETRES